MAIKNLRTKQSMILGVLGICLYLDAYQRLEAYHELLKQQQIALARQTKERKKLLASVVYSQEFLIKTWLHGAQIEDCQVIKIHPWVRDPKFQHFRLQLQGEYSALLKWLARVARELPDLKWEKLSLVANRELKLELVVECYARV
jgi:hypothetical protein